MKYLSQTPVREAFVRLAQEKLLVVSMFMPKMVLCNRDFVWAEVDFNAK